MAAHLIEPTELIDVSSLSMLIYGPPGTGKTSLAQTAADPVTLDLDRGIHRSFNRRSAMRFDCWRDVEQAAKEIARRATVVVDTIGRALDLLSVDICDANPKHGTKAGGLTLQGYGALKTMFANWNNHLWAAGKDRILIAHEREDKDGDERIMRPDVQGGSYTELMKSCDLVGYLYRDRQGKRFLDFNPTDRHLGKNAAGWPVLEVPELEQHKAFLADLLTDAKGRIGRTAEASAALARVVDEWTAWLDSDPTLADLNARVAKDLPTLPPGIKAQIWHIVTERTTRAGLTFDRASKRFAEPAKATVPA